MNIENPKQKSADPNIIIYSNCRIAPKVPIGSFSILGKPARPNIRELNIERKLKETVISEDCYIGTHVSIGEGTVIESGTIIEDYCVIEDRVKIGSSSYIVHGARILAKSKIGNNCVVGGFVAERAQIGHHSRMFGMLIHKHEDPSYEWDEIEEPAPTLDYKVIVGMGAIVIGGIKIGHHVYISSGAVVTKDVPPGHVVIGINKASPMSQWQGKLKDSSFFRDRDIHE